MSELTVKSRNEITLREIGPLARVDQWRRDLGKITDLASDCYANLVSADEVAQGAKNARSVMQAYRSEMIEMLCQQAEPASKKETGRLLQRLVVSFPSAAGTDLRGYGASLLEQVSETRPSRYAIEAAVRYLIRTEKWLPSIARVLEVIEAEQSKFQSLCWDTERLPQTVANIDRIAADYQAREAKRLLDAAKRHDDGWP